MSDDTARRQIGTGGVLCYLLPIALFLLLRFPMAMHSAGGQDEQFFSVPGYTVSREGVPRIPYTPTRRRETYFENADKCVMALPPALFYVQAPFFWLFEPGYPTSRLPLILSGVGAIAVAVSLVRLAGGSWGAAGLAGFTLAVSRPLMFTGTMARPDLACMLCGWLAIRTLWTARPESSWRRFALAGVAVGAGGLFHPFALVFCLQCGVWCLLVSGSVWQRFVRAFHFALHVVLIMSLWLPLIWAFPYEFSSQFMANVLERSGPGLVSRLLIPADSVRHHAVLVWQFLGPCQTLLFVAGMIGGLITLYLRNVPFRHRWLGLALSSVYLSATVAGVHPTKGYWVYAFLLVVVLLAVAVSPWCAYTPASTRLGSTLRWALAYSFAAALVIPGAGLKTSSTYLTHWGDPRFHAGHFIKDVLQNLPQDGIYYADSAYVFDIYLSGRETRLCQPRNLYWGNEPLTYRGILVAADGAQYGHPKDYEAVLNQTFGSRDLPQSCYVDWYTPRQENP